METTILTKAQVIKNNPDFKNLINAVISQLGGTESIEDINAHGIDGGYSGFIYYSDTYEFAKKNQKKIVELLEYEAEEFGQDVVEMVSGFGVFRNHGMDQDEKKALYRYLGGSKKDIDPITNIMAWFAAEEVCRMFEQ